tara:strand:- start:18 stop:605 length:588 start_codon:yes stop_codon:yes gene_type:complete
MKKLLLINGPPRSGKDTFFDIMHTRVESCSEYKMSRPLKDIFGALFNMNWLEQDIMLEEKKDETILDVGMSPREILIMISEEWIKPKFGDHYLGIIGRARIRQMDAKNIIITDSGFDYEIPPLIEEFGYDNLYLIQLSRPDYTFENDSRDYIGIDSIKPDNVAVIHNNDDLNEYKRKIIIVLRDFGFEIIGDIND